MKDEEFIAATGVETDTRDGHYIYSAVRPLRARIHVTLHVHARFEIVQYYYLKNK